MLHVLWTKAVGTPNYDKKQWQQFERQLKSKPEPYGYEFNRRLYKSLDELSGRTMSEGNVPVAVYTKPVREEWISVKDDLPKEDVYVLCAFKAGISCALGTYSKSWGGFCLYGEAQPDYRITHWLPLPPKPTEI